jgi:hypothetical protein
VIATTRACAGVIGPLASVSRGSEFMSLNCP